jgi:hypothetical protein
MRRTVDPPDDRQGAAHGDGHLLECPRRRRREYEETR